MKRVATILLLIWMGFIFYNSATPGIVSNHRSNEIVDTILKSKNFIEGENQQSFNLAFISDDFTNVNYILRKNAHAFEYLILAVLVATVLNLFGSKGKNAIIYIMFSCLLYAVLDEFHQGFVLGRTSLVSDVLIDFGGSIIGIILYFTFVNVYSKVIKKRHNDKRPNYKKYIR